jgi:hypothetical protein
MPEANSTAAPPMNGAPSTPVVASDEVEPVAAALVPPLPPPLPPLPLPPLPPLPPDPLESPGVVVTVVPLASAQPVGAVIVVSSIVSARSTASP